MITEIVVSSPTLETRASHFKICVFFWRRVKIPMPAVTVFLRLENATSPALEMLLDQSRIIFLTSCLELTQNTSVDNLVPQPPTALPTPTSLRRIQTPGPVFS